MAGYDGYSKSYNALDAESEGKFPATVLARRLKVSAAAIKKYMEPCEWHHTSSQFNRTEYYDGSCVTADELEQMRNYRPEKKAEVIHENCFVKWLEWTGSRNHPTCTEREANGCRVTDKGGAFVVVGFEDGGTMRKKKTCNGFSFAVA